MLGYKRLGSLLMAAVVMLAIPATASAQFARYSSRMWSFDLFGGVAIPLSDLGDVSKAGPSFGVGGNYYINSRFSLRIEGSLDLLRAEDSGFTPNPDRLGEEAPNISLYHIVGGFEYDLIDPTQQKARLTFYLMGGGVAVNSQKFSTPASSTFENGLLVADWQDFYPEVRGGFRLGVALSDCTPGGGKTCAAFFVNGGAHLMFGNEDDTIPITDAFAIEPFGTFFDIPLQIGFKINVL